MLYKDIACRLWNDWNPETRCSFDGNAISETRNHSNTSPMPALYKTRQYDIVSSEAIVTSIFH